VEAIAVAPSDVRTPEEAASAQQQLLKILVRAFSDKGGEGVTMGDLQIFSQITQAVRGREREYLATVVRFEQQQGRVDLGQMMMLAGVYPDQRRAPIMPSPSRASDNTDWLSNNRSAAQSNAASDEMLARHREQLNAMPSTSAPSYSDRSLSSARTGMPLTSVDGGYVGTNGQFYIPGGSDGAINARTGQFEPFEYTGR
jgi:hypothetical protein